MLHARRRIRRFISQIARLPMRLPATSSGLLVAGVGCFLGLRCVALVQLAVALASGSLQHSSRPLLSLAAATIFLAESAVVAVLLWRRRTPVAPDLALVDVTTVCLLYVAQIWHSPSGSRAVTWDGWVFGVTFSATFLIICLPRWRWSLLGVAAISFSYALTVGPAAAAHEQTAVVLANSLGFTLNVIVSRLGWLYLLRLAQLADRAVVRANRTQKRVTVLNERISHLLHSQTGNAVAFLKQLDLAEMRDAPAELNELYETLWESTQRARGELAASKLTARGETLGDVLHQAAAGAHAQLHISCTTFSVDELALNPDVLGAVGMAVDTLLANVRTHSGTREAIIYGVRRGDNFEVSVTDHGVGFPLDCTQLGYGLGATAGEHLTNHGLSVHIITAVGEGTTVTLRGPVSVETNGTGDFRAS